MPPRRRFSDDLFTGLDAPPPARRRTYGDDLFAGLDAEAPQAPEEEGQGPDWIATGLRVVPGIVGGAINTFTGGGAGAGAALGALGGGGGEAAAQAYEYATGQREDFNPTQIGVQTALGAVPGVGLGKHLKGFGGIAARGAVNTGYGAVVGGVTNPLVERVEEQGVSGLDPVAMMEDPQLGSRISRGAGWGAAFGAAAGALGEGVGAYANRRARLRQAEIEANYDPAFDEQRAPLTEPPPTEPPAAPPPAEPPPAPVTPSVTPEPLGTLPPPIPRPPAMEIPSPIPQPFQPPPPPVAPPPVDAGPIVTRGARQYVDEFDELLPAEAPAPPAEDPDAAIRAMLEEADALDAQANERAGMREPDEFDRLNAQRESPEDEVARLMREMGVTDDAIAAVEPEAELVGVGVNASGESAASQEAISRLAGMSARGERFAVRTRNGYMDLTGPDAVDYRVRPNEEYGVIDAEGNFRVLDRGENAPTTPAPRAPRLRAEGRSIAGTPGQDAQPGQVYRMAPSELEIRPKEMQYKGGTDEAGVTQEGRIQGPWDVNAEGVVLAWKDPKTGRLVTVNGHHRVEAAKRLGVNELTVRVLDESIQDPAAARAVGALTNIKEERGTPVDVAKLIRDSGFTPAMFREAGIPANSKLSRLGFALSQLQEGIFGRVAMGELEPEIAAAIAGGDRPLSPEGQNAVLAIYERNKNRPQPRELTPDQIRGVAEEVRAAQEVNAAAGAQASLFGDEAFQNTAVEKADLRDWLRRQIAGERRDFGAVAKKGRAERVAEAGNELAVAENQRRAQAAAEELKTLEKVGASVGPLNDLLEDAAQRILQGENPNAVRTNLLAAARAAIQGERGRAPAAAPVAELPFGGDRGGTPDQPPIGADAGRPTGAAENGPEGGAARPVGEPASPTGEPAPVVEPGESLSAFQRRTGLTWSEAKRIYDAPRQDELADLLPTGEAQPRLPGDVGAVRDVENPTPKEEAPFSLTNEIGKRSEKQTTLDDMLGGERGAVNIGAVAPLGGALSGAAAGAASADEDATWQERASRAVAGGLAGAALGAGVTAGSRALRSRSAAAGQSGATPRERGPRRPPSTRQRGDDLLDIDRFEKYADAGGTEEAMRDAAKAIPREEVAAWKGVSTDEMMRQAAAELDVTPEEMRAAQGDVADLRERVMAMRAINKGAFSRARELAEAVRSNPNDAVALAEFNAALDGWLGVQRAFTGARAEAGRFLRDFRQMAIEGISADNLQDLVDAVGSAQSRDRIAAIADRMATFDPNDLRRANRFVNEAKQATTGEKIHRIWLNLLLSGPKTHIANMVSTGLASVTLPLDRTAAGMLDLIRAKGTAKPQERFVREGVYTAVGMVNGIIPGLRAGLRTMRTGETSFGEALSRAGDVTGGRPTASILSEGPFIRALKAQDEVWKSVVEAGDLYGRAVRQALREGVRGRAIGQRVADILDNPTKELRQASQKEALYRTFNADPGEIGRWLISGRKKVPGASVVFPFLNTPINIAKFGVQHTPLYASKILYDLAKGKYKNRPGPLQEELAKVVTGSLLATGVAAAYERGWITGGGRPERAKHATDVAARPDYSIKLGENWYSYNRLEPLGMSMGLVADYMELIKNKDQDDSQASKIIYSFARNLGSKTFLQAASDLFEAMTDPNGYKRDRFISNLAGSVVPTVIADVARVMDPVQRRTRGVAERIQQRTPGVSQDLRPVVNIFGEPVSEGHVGAVERFVSPVRRRPVVDDPLLDELRRLGIDLDVPSDKLTTDQPMSASDKSALVQAKGQATKRALQRTIDRPAYQRADDEDKEALLNRAINEARDDISRKARWKKRRGDALTLEALLGVR